MDTCSACGDTPGPSHVMYHYMRWEKNPMLRLHDHIVDGELVGRLCFQCKKLAGYGDRIVSLGEYLARVR